MTQWARRPVDLTDCDPEPIHIPGSVQPHGALLAFGPDATVAVASANAAALLGADVAAGAPIARLLGPELAARVTQEGTDAQQPARVRVHGRLRGGAGELLDVPRGPALGVTADATYATMTLTFDRQSMLVLFTDGLVERRGDLRAAAVAHGPVDDLCDRLLAAMPEGDEEDDDVAVVTVRRAEG